MRETKEEIIRFCFTKYVETALNRAKRDYMKKEKKRSGMEVISDLELLFLMQQKDGEREDTLSLDMVADIPWKPEAVRSFFVKSVDDRMLTVLSCLTDIELLIVFAKVFRQMKFIDIAEIMGLDWKKVASSYSYARKKMKKGWKKNGIS